MNNRLSTKRSRSLSLILALAALALATAGSTARAQTVTFYFAQVGSTVPITNIVTTGPGQIINLSVYFQVTQTSTPAFTPNSADVFVTFDRTDKEGDTNQFQTVTPIDNKLGLNGDTGTGATSAVSNINPAFLPLYFGGDLGGGQTTDTTPNAIRPYGDDLSFGTAAGTSFTPPLGPTHLFDISLKNLALSSGSATISIYNGGIGTDFTTYLNDPGDSGLTPPRPAAMPRPPTYNLTVTAIAAPEPSAVISLLLGASLLALQLWRVRGRLRRTVN